MLLELGDECVIRNDKTNIDCKVEFKTKGFFSGEYNAIAGKIKSGGKDIGDVSGTWSDKFTIRKKVGRDLCAPLDNT